MPRVTHLFKTYFPNTQGGLEEAIRQIGKFSVKSGLEVKVVSVSKNPFDGKQDGINCKSYYHSFGSNSLPISIDLIKNYNKIIKETDILHLHFPWPPGELLTLVNNVTKPIVITFHCDIHNRRLIRTIYTPFIKRLFQKASIIVPTSENLMNSTSVLSNFKDKCHPINLWLDEERFINLREPNTNFQENVKELGDFCLFIGVLRWYKGLDFLLDAAKKITGNIVIVGKGPLFFKLKKRIEIEKLSNVFLLGFQPDENVKLLIQKSRFIILPSISPAEAFGQVLLEASYFKKPMVTTELGTGTSFVNFHQETGFVIEPYNITLLYRLCNELFRDDNLVSTFGQNAFKRYKENFTQESAGPKYIDIYKTILSR